MSDSIEKNKVTAVGKVASAGGDKTCIVQIDRQVKHPLYGKYFSQRTKLAVHDPENAAGVGDTVSITLCRPISKTKRWRLLEVVEKAKL